MASTSGFIHPLSLLRETRCKKLLTMLFCILVCTLGFHTGVSAFEPGKGLMPGAPDLTHQDTKISKVKDSSIADGNDQNIVKAHIVDKDGIPVPGVIVFFASSSGGLTPGYPTDVNGDAFLQFPSSVVGDVLIRARITTGFLEGGRSESTHFKAGPPAVNVASTEIIKLNDFAIANEVDIDHLRAHVTDENGHPVAGQDIVFTIDSGLAKFKNNKFSGVTDANGNFDIELISKVAGKTRIWATVNGVPFNFGNPARVNFKADVPSTSNPLTKLFLVTNLARADNIATNSVRAHVVDANGNPVIGTDVTFIIETGTATFAVPNPVATDANGDAIITFVSKVAGNVKIRASVGGNLISNTIGTSFIAGPPDVTNTFTGLLVTANGAIANDVATNQVTARIRDKYGNAVNLANVEFFIFQGVGRLIGATIKQTNPSGLVSIDIASTLADTVRIVAKVEGQDIVFGSPAKVWFIADQPSTGNPATQLSPLDNNRVANNAALNSVKAHIVDANGNPVKNADVKFTIAGGTAGASATLIDPDGDNILKTDAKGDAIMYLKSPKAGTVMLSATVNGSPIPALGGGFTVTVTFVAGVPNTGNPATLISKDIDGSVANNTALNSVKVHIADVTGNPVPNAPVKFIIAGGTAGGSATLIDPDGDNILTTDANGDVIMYLKSPKAGTVDMSATVFGAAIKNATGGTIVTVTFVADVPNTGNPATLISKDVDGSVANNTALNSVKVHIADANGNPVANAPVKFTIAGGTAGGSATLIDPDGDNILTTDANGDVIMYLKSPKAGTVDMSASVNGSPVKNATGGTTVTVTFVAGVPNTGNPATLLSKLDDNRVADNAALNSVKVHIADVTGNPVPNAPVKFAIAGGSAGGSATLIDPDGDNILTTDANGDVIMYLKSPKAGTVDMSATVFGAAIKNATGGTTVTVTFVADVPNTGNPATLLSKDVDGSIANNTALNSVKVHIADANGNPVANAPVKFTIAGGTAGAFATLIDPDGDNILNTDANGDVIMYLKSPKVGTVDMSASVNGSPVKNATGGTTVTVTFVADVPNTGDPATLLSKDVDGSVANNTALNSVKVHIADANGNPVANAPVLFAIAGGTAAGSATLVDPDGDNILTTDANGDVIMYLKSTKAGTVDMSATVNGTPIKNATGGTTVTVTFVADVPNTGNPSTLLSKDVDGSLANNTALNSVKVHIADANGNPVANAPVLFTIAGGTAGAQATLIDPDGDNILTTDANGDVIMHLKSPKAGTVDMSASVNGSPVKNATGGTTVTVTFGADVPNTGNPATLLSKDVDGSVANNTALNSVKVHIADANGNPVANTPVLFTIAGGTAAGSATLVDPDGDNILNTDANGDVIMYLKSPKVGTVDMSASVNGSPIKNATGGTTVTVTFVADVPNTGNPATLLSKDVDGSVANNTALNSVKVHIADANGNPVANAPVLFTIASGTAGAQATLIDPDGDNILNTDANGDVIMFLKSPKVGTVDMSASVNGSPIKNATGGLTVTVTFVADAPSTGNPATLLSKLDDKRVADNTALNSVKAHIADANGNPVPNAPVHFTIAGGTAGAAATLVDPDGDNIITTDANGDAIMYLKSPAVGTVDLSATVNGAPIPAVSGGVIETVTFVVGPPDVTKPETALIVEVDSVVANGTALNKIRAHIVDAGGHPVENATIVFTKVSGDATIVEAGPFLTDANGDVVITLHSTVAGNVVIKAAVNGTDLIHENPATITFVPGDPDPTKDATTLSIVTNNALADGKATNSVKAHIVDAYLNKVPGASVVFTIANGTATIVQTNPIITDANGDAIITLTSTVSGTVDITATVNGMPIDAGKAVTVTFTSDPDVSIDETRLIVVSNDAIADGIETNSVKAHIVDANRVPLPHKEVFFRIESGDATVLTVQPVLTDVNGDATILLASKTAGAVQVTAKVGTKDIINGSPAKLRFVPVDIYVPKIFTPNDDGKNDIVKPIIVGITTFHYFNIYNRWGNLVFSTKDPNVGWDGRFKGILQPVETYLWIAEGLDKDKKKITRRGMISLVR
jgi:adhesin/invasin